MTTLAELRAEIDASVDREKEGVELAEEAAELEGSLRQFVRAAWPVVMPRAPIWTWHIDAICDHVQACYDRLIPRLVITIQPGSLKSSIVSVFGPAWQWTRKPSERIVSASHTGALANRDARKSRELMQSLWFQARWGDLFEFTRDENLKQRYSNDRNGHRVTTHVGGGTGDRGAILSLDDPHNAQDATATELTKLNDSVEWFSNTWVSRMDDLVGDPGAMVVIGQRIHEADLIGHILAGRGWTHLSLPTRYMRKNPVLGGKGYPAKVKVGAGRTSRVLQGDPRSKEGEILAPKVQNEKMLRAKIEEDGLTAHVFAGQYQQIPAPREGKLLKRADWRYYDPLLSFYSRERFGRPEVAELASLVGPFDLICCSWDTSVKDRAHSDYVSGQAWGCINAQRFLLRLYHERAGLNETCEAMISIYNWCIELWPDLPVYNVIEAQANGKDAAAEIQSQVQGVIVATAQGSKWMRAEAAEPALVGHNCFLPGYPQPDGSSYDDRTPIDVQEFVEELASFDTGANDDQVDGWSSMCNWTRGRGRVSVSVPSGQVQPQRFLRPSSAFAQAQRVRPQLRG
jgi:phage terminase large subunit-like protein